MQPMDTCRTRSGWDIRPGWLACKAPHTDGYGCQWNTMLETRFLAHKRKPWCWRLKSAAGSAQDGARISCKSGSKPLFKSREPAEKRLVSQRVALAVAQRARQEILAELQEETKHKRIPVIERRCVRREKAVQVALKKLGKTQAWMSKHLEQEKALRKRLEQFEQENTENPQPVKACFRLGCWLWHLRQYRPADRNGL